MNLRIGTLAFALLLTACGPEGPAGTPGEQGPAGKDGQDGAPGETRVSQIALPGMFFPESISAGKDGTLYVSSLATSAILAIPPGEETGDELVPPAGKPNIATNGVLADEGRGVLWACVNDFSFQTLPFLKGYDPSTGVETRSFSLPGPAAGCNDMTLDGKGNLYVTDSVGGRVLRLTADLSTFEVWSENPAYVSDPGTFSLDGIAWDGGTNLYVNKYQTGQLFRVPIASGGKAGSPVEITTSRPLVLPDGMRWTGSALLLVEGAENGTIASIDVATGEVTTIANHLDYPTSLVVVDGAAWVTEGQLARLLGTDKTPANLPFSVRRIPLPE